MSKKLKLLVIGLDGATFNIIDPLLEKLPNIKKLMASGVRGNLRSTIPPMSPSAWATFMTGQNPGQHGIFHWRGFDLTDYSCLNETFVSSSLIAGKTFVDYLGESGCNLAIITIPITYPPWAINGIMVAGYPCPDTQKNYTWPIQYANELEVSYNLSADHYLHANEDAIIEKGLWLLKERSALALKCIDKKDIDACILVLGEIDRAQHNFWKYRDSSFPEYHTKEGNKYRDVIDRHYIACDKHIGSLLEKVDDRHTTVIVMSDHGGAPIPKISFLTNSWLLHKGFLSLKKQKSNSFLQKCIAGFRKAAPYENKLRELLPKKIVQKARQIYLGHSNIDWSKTQAYRFPMYQPAEGISINLKGRQPEGIVDPKDYDRLRKEIMDELQSAKDYHGDIIVDKIYTREEIYTGKFLCQAPDIVFLTNPKIKGEAGIAANNYIQNTYDPSEKISGLHSMNGIFIASGRHFKADHVIEDINIADIAPSILYDQESPIPHEMTGIICWEAFKEEYIKKSPPQFVEKTHTQTDDTSLDREEKKQIEAKLKGLGYL